MKSTTSRSTFSLVVATLSLSLAACASAPDTFGTRARFSPAFQGYVMAPDNGSDDPAVDDPVLLLRDPMTGDKIRCKDQVAAFRELHEDLAADAVHDDNVAMGVGITTGAVFAPMVVMAPVGALVLTEAMLTSGTLYDAFDSDTGPELFGMGIELFRRERFLQAASAIEHALAKDPSLGTNDKAFLYLGLSYAKVGKKERAARALAMYIDRAGVRDIDSYRTAAEKLVELGVEREKCASIGPVNLRW